MTDKDKTDESLRFVTRHFEDNTLLPDQGWRLFRSAHSFSTFRHNVAAACVGLAVIAASAAIYYFTSSPQASTEPESITAPAPETTAVAPEQRIERIEFRDATLRTVVAEIERVYGVSIGNVPQQDMRITISYEGTAADAVETINDLLGTSLTVSYNSDTAK